MDAPNPALPMYTSDAHCHHCGQIRGPRREFEHPERGMILVCGVCLFVLRVPE